MKRLMMMLIVAVLWGITGCASTTTTSASSITESAVKTEVVTLTPAAEPRCPPETNGRPLERDLTVPFSQRTYLLDSGELCTPSAYLALPLGWVTEPAPSSSDTLQQQGALP